MLWLKVPIALQVARAALGGVLLVAATGRISSPWIVLVLVAGVLSDVLDGMIARRLGVVTARMRTADGWIDAWFFMCALFAAWMLRGDVLQLFVWPLAGTLLLYGVSLTAVWIRHRRIASYHAHSARVAGGLLFLAAVDLFLFKRAGWFLWVAIAAVVISHVERIAIALILPAWKHDMPSFWHALRARQNGTTNRA